MNTRLVSSFCTWLLTIGSAAAQPGFIDDRGNLQVEPVLPDGGDATDPNPELTITAVGIVLRARARAPFVLVVAIGTQPVLEQVGEDGILRGAQMLRCGWTNPDGTAILPMPALQQRGGATIDAVLQAVVVETDGRTLTCSPLARWRLGVDWADIAPEQPTLKLHNELPDLPAHATLVSTDSIPPQWSVGLRVDAPTTGYALRHVSTVREEASMTVVFELDFPDPNSAQLTVIQALHASAHLGEAEGRIDVHLRRAASKGDDSK